MVTTMWVLLVVMTLVSIMLICFGYLDKEISSMLGVISLIWVVLFGWGLAGMMMPVRTNIQDIKPNFIHKTGESVYVEYGGYLQMFNDVAIKDDTVFEMQIGYNMYGFPNWRKIRIKRVTSNE